MEMNETTSGSLSSDSLASRLRALFRRSGPLPSDRPVRVRLRALLFAAGCLMPLLTALLARFPAAVERVYAGATSPFLSRALTRISSVAPFSVAEVAAFGIVLYTLWVTIRAAVQIIRGRRRLLNAIACGALWIGGLTGTLLILAYVFWGFNFARAGIISRQHWAAYLSQKAVPESERDELIAYCSTLVNLANREFDKAERSVSPGAVGASTRAIAGCDASLEEAYATLARRLGLHASVSERRGPAKRVLASFVMTAGLIGGFYSPWTGEANYNRDLPGWQIPQTIAHEKAHQRGFPSEDEANFLGILACIHSRDPYARYSGYLFAQLQLLGELRKADPGTAGRIASRRAVGVQRDVDLNRKFIERHRGAISNLNARAIDTYLKANRTPGMSSYAMSSRLLIVYARAVDRTFGAELSPE